MGKEVSKNENNTRDIVLAVLSAVGLDMLTLRLFTWYFMIVKNQTLIGQRFIASSELLLYLVGVILIYKKINVSPTYKKWFLIVAAIVFISNLAMDLLLLL